MTPFDSLEQMDRADRRTLLCSVMEAVIIPLAGITSRRMDGMENVVGDSHSLQATKIKPAIARIWRGRVKRDRADEYQKYNYEFGVKPLIEKAMGVQAFREDRADETEFVTISYWENVEAMSRFTGGDPKKIHHLPRDPEFLVEIPQAVQILNIYESHGQTG